MPFARLKPIVKSLRFRLAAWNALAVILTSVVTLLALRTGLQLALWHETDQVLLDDLLEIELIARDEARDRAAFVDELDRKAMSHVHHLWFVQIFDASGTETWASDHRPAKMRSLRLSERSFPCNIDGYRVDQRTMKISPGFVMTVRVGSSLEMVDQDLARIDRTALVAGGLVMLVAPLGGFLLAGRATRLLGHIIETADRMHPEDLSERLPLHGMGDELDHLALTINGLLDRIAAYLQQNREFVSNAAHEMRSPLAAIRSSAEVTLSKRRAPEAYEEFIGDVIDEASALTTLVNQLLLLAESESDRLRIHGERFRLDEIAAKVVDMFSVLAESRGIDFVYTKTARRSSRASRAISGRSSTTWSTMRSSLPPKGEPWKSPSRSTWSAA